MVELKSRLEVTETWFCSRSYRRKKRAGSETSRDWLLSGHSGTPRERAQRDSLLTLQEEDRTPESERSVSVRENMAPAADRPVSTIGCRGAVHGPQRERVSLGSQNDRTAVVSSKI